MLPSVTLASLMTSEGLVLTLTYPVPGLHARRERRRVRHEPGGKRDAGCDVPGPFRGKDERILFLVGGEFVVVRLHHAQVCAVFLDILAWHALAVKGADLVKQNLL